jgi:hypothetical protein
MSRSFIDHLNADAAERVRAGATGPDAVRAAARDARLVVIRYGDGMILYCSQRQAYVNARIVGRHGSYVGPGGAGFDDQIDWAFPLADEEVSESSS